MALRPPRGGLGLWPLMVLVLGLGLIPGCDRRGNADAKDKPKPKSPVSVGVTARRDVPVQLPAIGYVEAYRHVEIKPQVTGQILKVHFTQGQFVKAGDLLFTIDPQSFEIAVARAQAAMEQHQAQAKDLRDEAVRKKELLARNAASQREVDSAMAQAEAMEAAVRADAAMLADAKLKLSYCQVVAPFDGCVGQVLADIGGTAKANDAPVLAVINQVEPIYVSFTVPESQLAQVRAALTANALDITARIPGDAGSAVTAHVTFLDNTIDTATGTLRLKATFPNQDHRLWPGQFLEITLTLATLKDAVVAPSQAVQMGQDGAYVFVVDKDHKADVRPVTTGPRHDGQVVILTGLEGGQTVVTDGHMRLRPGTEVEIKTSAAAATAPAGQEKSR